MSEALRGARVAIIHDWFQGFHGSERVVDAMARHVFADAETVDILTFSAAKEVLPDDLARRIVKVSRMSRLPGVRQRGHDAGRWRYLLPYMPAYFANLDLDDYDIVVSSSHSCAVNVRPRPDALHLCYCYTPMRYAWFTDVDRGRLAGPQAVTLRALSGWLRRVDAAAATRVDAYATLSSDVRTRIQQCYGREAELIFPPVDTQDFRTDSAREPGHFLWVHRMVAYKRPLLVSRAFEQLPYRLTMVGVGPLAREVAASAPSNVTVRGWVERSELRELYARASGFIHVGEEDFGITMVEALAAGMPVVALDRGGSRDIVRDGRDGILISEASESATRAALVRCADTAWDPDALAQRAELFSRENFVRRFRAFAERKIADKAALRGAHEPDRGEAPPIR